MKTYYFCENQVCGWLHVDESTLQCEISTDDYDGAGHGRGSTEKPVTASQALNTIAKVETQRLSPEEKRGLREIEARLRGKLTVRLLKNEVLEIWKKLREDPNFPENAALWTELNELGMTRSRKKPEETEDVDTHAFLSLGEYEFFLERASSVRIRRYLRKKL